LRYNFFIYLFLVVLAFGYSANANESAETESASLKITAQCIDTIGSSFIDARQHVCMSTNTQRVRYGSRPLILDSTLSRAAQIFARDMATRKYFSHNSPEGRDLKWRLKTGQIVYMSAGENIAMGYKTSDEVIRGWMNSPGHRKNMLAPKFGRIGVGYSNNYWVQIFAN